MKKSRQRNARALFSAIFILMIGVMPTAYGQNARTVSGTVTDSINQMTLPGVNIMIQQSGMGTITDENGEYTLSVSPDDVLVFSYIGYKTRQVTVGNKSQLNLLMATDAQALDELVVVGYGKQKKSDLTGSVEVVNMEKFKSSPSRSAEHALQGMASGVNVVPSGVPGAGARILIRGISSFGDASPLVIVDGIEQDLNLISAKDIESVQVLKDAGAAAIYGVRGANGVILVTTKQGKKGKPVISYEGSYGVQYALKDNPFNVLNSSDYMKVYNVAFGADNQKFANGMPDYMYRGPSGAGVAFEGDPAVNPDLYLYNSPNQGSNYIIQKVNKEGTDWFGELFKNAPVLNQDLSVSGGSDKSTYFFGLNYRNHKGTLVNTELNRYSVRVNTKFDIGNRIRVGENLNIVSISAPGFNENTDFGGIIETVKQEPIVPIRDIGGNWGGSFGGPSLGDAQNPVAQQYRNIDNDVNNTWRIIGNGYAEVDILKNLIARTSLGINVSNSFNQNFTGSQVENVQASTGQYSFGVSSNYANTMTFTNTLNFSESLGKNVFSVLAGSESIRFISRGVSGGSSNFFTSDFNYLTLGNGTENITNSSSISENTLFSLFGRLDYSYNNKYLLSATIRRDGSSKFGPNNRYGIFPSMSVGWKLSEEQFAKDIEWLDEFKFRASYGVLGSQSNVSSVNAYSLFGSGRTSTYYDISGSGNSIVDGFATSRIGNTNTGWEENIVTNIGVDMAILNDQFNFSIEYYKKSIKGLLFTQPLPAVVIGGASSPSVNIGDIQNTGIDFSTRYRYSSTNGISFDIGGNFTTYKNEIVDIPDPGYFSSGSNQAVGAMVRNEEGYPISSYFGYEFEGLFNSQQDIESSATQSGADLGRMKFRDVNNDGEITPDDRTHLGDPHPDFTYGLNLNLSYANFDFSLFFYGSQGNEIYNLTKSYLHLFQFYPTTNKSNDLLNAWSPENTNTTIPKIETTPSFSSGTTGSSYYIEDGSFLKLRTMTIGYNVDNNILSKLNIANFRVYVQALNLLTFTKYSGLDPELVGGGVSATGIDRGSYPNNEKGIYFGVNLTF